MRSTRIRQLSRSTLPLAALGVALALGAGCTRDVGGDDQARAVPGVGTEDAAPAEPTPSEPSGSTSVDTAPTVPPDESAEVLEGTLQVRAVEEANPSDTDGVDCSATPRPTVETPAEERVVACDALGVPYLLAPAAIEGGVASAEAENVDDTTFVVSIEFEGDAARVFAEVTGQLATTGQQMALVLDGRVLAAPSVQESITGGTVQISSSFTQAYAEALAAAIEDGG
ncbi:SecDF P1 head subdomain-containing protein [Nocardioides nanhaiensis]|uniref:SecDF P1 head subdomain-containing protein n=1 Tax=Nocardioides nanhaiensis TaxID=1476871 RepID=UPI0031EC5C84